MKRLGQSSFLILLVACVIAFSLPNTAQATTLPPTFDPAIWAANVAPGDYLEQFTALTGNLASPITFQGPFPANGFSYTADESGSGGLFGLSGALTTADNGLSGHLILTFTGSPTPVTAIGGNFYSTDVNGVVDLDPISMIMTLLDGNTVSLTLAATSPATFAGFLSIDGVPFQSLEIFGPGDLNGNPDNDYPTIANFDVGEFTVPEPGTFGLLGGALIGLGLLAKRWMK